MEPSPGRITLETILSVLRPILVFSYLTATFVIYAHYMRRIIITNIDAALKILRALFSINLVVATYVIFSSYTLLDEVKDFFYLYLRIATSLRFEYDMYLIAGYSQYAFLPIYRMAAFVLLYFSLPRDNVKVLMNFVERLRSKIRDGAIDKDTYDEALKLLSYLVRRLKLSEPIRRIGIISFLSFIISRIPVLLFTAPPKNFGSVAFLIFVLFTMIYLMETVSYKSELMERARGIALVYKLAEKE